MRVAYWLKLVSVVVLAAFLSVGITYAADAPKAPVLIKADGAKMAPVAFSHEKHGKVDCAKCHHVKDKPTAACNSCHDLKEAKNNAPKIQDAFHKLCLDCHKAQGGNAPTKCNDCHKK
jgi:predicted CXXCH cytochrome family protein